MSTINQYIRFKQINSKHIYFGKIIGDKAIALSSAPWLEHIETGEQFKLTDIDLLAPVIPSKIVCVGLNYHAHVDASFSADKAPARPMLFLKPPSSIIGPDDNIVHTDQSQRVDFEAELGIVIGKRAKNVSREEALDHILGYTCVNDVTARDLQKADGQWGRAKGFDTFCPVGPVIVTGIDYINLNIKGILNGETKQAGNTKDMIFDVLFIVSYISTVMTLEPGDLISTGTPSGIEPMKPGDTIEVNVEHVGTLSNKVVLPDD
jgi:2-keto-4-pentenoate hydratase/2-oxohepta-3-ene-1,7-dioic acid hydratase in catechol pathway